MKKDMMRAVIAAAIILVLYNLVVFLIPFPESEIFWINYLFTLAAFVVVGVSFYQAFLKNPDAKTSFYNFPKVRVGCIYGVLQLVVSLVAMALGDLIPWEAAVLVYAAMMGFFVIKLMSIGAVVDHIESQDAKAQVNVAVMRSLQSKVNQLATTGQTPALQKLAEEIRYSDPVSSAAVAEAEADLSAAIDALQDAVVDGDAEAVEQLCRKATMLLAERNRLCKLGKR